ncbi:hypothetical protein BGZ76_005441 [Entomortierella beljakovae]|nr:hypothetical protein BGZ76_005441 [Entomortierella beljakovae]
MATVNPTSSFKFPHPPTFNGTCDGFIVLAWLGAFHRFFKGANIPDAQQTLHAVVFLTGPASLWWEAQGVPDEISYATFEKAFLEEFIPAGFVDHVRHLLVTVKFESTLSEYVTLVRKYMNILCTSEMPEGAHQELDKTARAAFLQGCPHDLKQMLLALEIGQNAPSNLHALLNAAEQFDKLYHFKPNGLPVSYNPSRHPPVLHSPNNPMAMEIDSLRLQLNAVMVALNNQSQPQFRPRSNYPPTRPNQPRPPAYHPPGQYQHPSNQIPPLSQEEREYLISTRGCFRCRQPGHFMRDCPRGVSLHHMTLPCGNSPGTAADPSGKDSNDKA